MTNIVKSTGANPVFDLFIFLYLLESYTNSIGHLFMTQTQNLAPQLQPSADINISLIRNTVVAFQENLAFS